jgi:hypothetical protein
MHSVQMSGSVMSLPTQQAQAQMVIMHWPAAGIGLPLVIEQVHCVKTASHTAKASYWLAQLTPGFSVSFSAATHAPWQEAGSAKHERLLCALHAAVHSSPRMLAAPASPSSTSVASEPPRVDASLPAASGGLVLDPASTVRIAESGV